MIFTPEQDARIRELYTPPYVRGLITKQAKEWGCKSSHISARRMELGLTKLANHHSSKRWTIEELTLLRKIPHLTSHQASLYLTKRGFHRTQNAVEAIRLKDGWRDRVDRDETVVGYTSVGLSRLLGVDHSTILRWIKKGFLEAVREDHDENSYIFRIKDTALRLFLVNYVHYWNPAKVDKYWLMDILYHTREMK